MPKEIVEWILARGISQSVMDVHHIGWNGTHIVIPIEDMTGNPSFNKYRRDPRSDVGPKYTYDKGAKASLYGNSMFDLCSEVIICEGELDCLLLQTKGFHAVTSTGGATTFKKEWADLFVNKDVYLCFDCDTAGMQALEKLTRMIPHAKYLPLPFEFGSKKDITDYFLAGNTPQQLRNLMSVSTPFPIEPLPTVKYKKKKHDTDLAQAKAVPIGLFIRMPNSGNAKCPLHNDDTPSFAVYKKDNRWHCFGGCGGGDVVDFIMKKNNLTMPEAIKFLNSQEES